ncbi:MAG: bifunctional folylpolyglutamate synthase/dihydrofolate synthase [Clostridia bacterium]|nr:bifunctional folylpolyglutamate synthase/dihydrofolate synthase [Clostridia bacterium]
MDREQAVSYIGNLPKFSYPLGNEQLEKLLSLLGNPHKELKFIHIAGTNGKGSAAAMLGSILENAGYRVGVFTSPYIIRFNERIRLGRGEIPDNKLAEYTERLADIIENNEIKLSQFAFILALALCYYRNEGCDLVVLEAGLGGRLDATNIIEESLVSVIMSIGLDHTEYLGTTIPEIAREKGGIIKENGSVAAYRSDKSALDVFEQICREKSARLYIAPKVQATEKGFAADGREYALALKGEYQADNAAVVLKTVEILREKGFAISENALEKGFLSAQHRARFERVRENIIVDGAHNSDGIRALCRALDSGAKTAVLAMMEDKAVDDALSQLKGFSEVIVTEIDMPRCMKAAELAKHAEKAGLNVRVIPDCTEAFKTAESCNFAVICGSIYLAGKALEYFDKKGVA